MHSSLMLTSITQYIIEATVLSDEVFGAITIDLFGQTWLAKDVKNLKRLYPFSFKAPNYIVLRSLLVASPPFSMLIL